MTQPTDLVPLVSELDKLPELSWFLEQGFTRWGLESWRGEDVQTRTARTIQQYEQRDRFIQDYGFSLPCREAVERIASYGPVVEIGAGTGYWAKLLSLAGVDIVATDSYTGDYRQRIGRHYPVERQMGAAAVKRYSPRTVFVSWPSYDDPWAYCAANVMEVGRHLIYIGEGMEAAPAVTASMSCWVPTSS